MRGSVPWLVAAVAVFLAVFAWQRARSIVLATEGDSPQLRALAERHGVEPAAVLALRAGAPDLAPAAFAARVERFAALAPALGAPLAALAVLSDDEELARRVLARGGGDPAAAWAMFRADAAALPALEFELRRQRFAARASGRSGS